MRKIIFSLILSGSIIILSGCNKKDNTESRINSFDNYIVSMLAGPDTITNIVMLSATQWLNAFPGADSPYNAGFGARFTNNGTLLNAGTLHVGPFTSTALSSNVYTKDLRDSSISSKKTAFNLQGTTVTMSVTGSSSVRAFSQQVYMPKKLINYTFRKGVHDGAAWPITWTPDNTTFNKVAIISTLHRTSGTPQSSDVVTFVVPDNGSYTIPPRAFIWPAGSVFDITIGRVTQIKYTDPVDGRITFLFGLVSATTGPVQKVTSY